MKNKNLDNYRINLKFYEGSLELLNSIYEYAPKIK